MKFSILLAALALVASPTGAQQQFNCPAEGFFVDPNDCSRFVRCVDTYQTGRFQVYNFNCPDGELLADLEPMPRDAHKPSLTSTPSPIPPKASSSTSPSVSATGPARCRTLAAGEAAAASRPASRRAATL